MKKGIDLIATQTLNCGTKTPVQPSSEPGCDFSFSHSCCRQITKDLVEAVYSFHPNIKVFD